MKNNPAKEMWEVIIMVTIAVLVSVAHFIFMSFAPLEIFWILFNITIAGAFITFYALRMQKFVYYSAIAFFAFNVFYHLVTCPTQFVAFGAGNILLSLSGLMYTISAGFLFGAFVVLLCGAILEKKKIFYLAVFGLYLSATFALIQGIITVFICNAGIKTWDACFPPLSMMVAFLILAIICRGDYIKQYFKFLQEEEKR